VVRGGGAQRWVAAVSTRAAATGPNISHRHYRRGFAADLRERRTVDTLRVVVPGDRKAGGKGMSSLQRNPFETPCANSLCSIWAAAPITLTSSCRVGEIALADRAVLGILVLTYPRTTDVFAASDA